jgi:hypothetical protein
MTTENKKMVYYGLGALALGAVAFFVHSFFQKEVVKTPSYDPTGINSSTPPEPIMDKEDTSTTDYKNIFSELGKKAGDLASFSFLRTK